MEFRIAFLHKQRFVPHYFTVHLTNPFSNSVNTFVAATWKEI
jgi:hypothetical protein